MIKKTNLIAILILILFVIVVYLTIPRVTYIEPLPPKHKFNVNCRYIGNYFINDFIWDNNGLLPTSMEEIKKYYDMDGKRKYYDADYETFIVELDAEYSIIKYSETECWFKASYEDINVNYIYLINDGGVDKRLVKNVTDFDQVCSAYKDAILFYLYHNNGMLPQTEKILIEESGLEKVEGLSQSEITMEKVSESKKSGYYYVKMGANNYCYIYIRYLTSDN